MVHYFTLHSISLFLRFFLKFHVFRAFNPLSSFPEVQTKRTWGIYLWSLIGNWLLPIFFLISFYSNSNGKLWELNLKIKHCILTIINDKTYSQLSMKQIHIVWLNFIIFRRTLLWKGCLYISRCVRVSVCPPHWNSYGQMNHCKNLSNFYISKHVQ